MSKHVTLFLSSALTVNLPFCKANHGTQIKLSGAKIRSISLMQGAMELDFRPWEIVDVSLTE